MSQVQDGGEAILEAFRNLGIDHIIASPGSEWPSVWEALARQKANELDGPRYIDCWHETLAVTMAMGYTRVTGRLQAVLLHAGVGLLQGSLGIQGAYQGEVPMLVCSGESTTNGDDPNFDPGAQWYRGLNVVGGANRWVEPFVKWSSHVTTPLTLYETLTRAGEMAQRVPQGPTYLDIPIEVMMHPWSPPARLGKVPTPPKLHPEPEGIKRVAQLLSSSTSPVIVTDSSGRDVAAFQQLVKLAELGSIPVVETGPTYANFPKDHPLYLGTDLKPFLHRSDLFLLVGSRSPWYPPSAGPSSGTVVVIGENPIKEQMVYQALHADLYLEGDLAATLSLLVGALGESSGGDSRVLKERRAYWEGEHKKLQERNRAAVQSARSSRPIDPTWLCAALNDVMPTDTTYVNETITHGSAILRHIGWSKPQSYFRANGGLGVGLGTALGVKLAKPQQPVVALIGDGSLLYNPIIPSLGVATGENLPILIVVFNNSSYAAMKGSHLSFYPDGVAAATSIYHGVDIHGPNYARLVDPFEGYGERVDDPDKLKPALERALGAVNAGQVALLDVILSS